MNIEFVENDVVIDKSQFNVRPWFVYELQRIYKINQKERGVIATVIEIKVNAHFPGRNVRLMTANGLITVDYDYMLQDVRYGLLSVFRNGQLIS